MIKIDSISVHEVMLFDSNFKLFIGKQNTGKHLGIAIENSTRRLIIEVYIYIYILHIRQRIYMSFRSGLML